jgi:hypothetical protein
VSAAARGAAGWLRISRGRHAARQPLETQTGEVEAFVQMLISKGVTETRARELAAEQQAKNFQRPRSGARR